MLGRQSSVLMTNEDLRDLESMLRQRGDVEILSDEPNQDRNALLPLKTLLIENPGEDSLTCYLAPTSGTRLVDIQPVSDVKVHISPETSEIVEVWRSYCPGDVIRRGRIFYTTRYFDTGSIRDKRHDFVTWAQKVVAAIRRSLTYDKSLMAYVGADAARRIASGELTVVT